MVIVFRSKMALKLLTKSILHQFRLSKFVFENTLMVQKTYFKHFSSWTDRSPVYQKLQYDPRMFFRGYNHSNVLKFNITAEYEKCLKVAWTT